MELNQGRMIARTQKQVKGIEDEADGMQRIKAIGFLYGAFYFHLGLAILFRNSCDPLSVQSLDHGWQQVHSHEHRRMSTIRRNRHWTCFILRIADIVSCSNSIGQARNSDLRTRSQLYKYNPKICFHLIFSRRARPYLVDLCIYLEPCPFAMCTSKLQSMWKALGSTKPTSQNRTCCCTCTRYSHLQRLNLSVQHVRSARPVSTALASY